MPNKHSSQSICYISLARQSFPRLRLKTSIVKKGTYMVCCISEFYKVGDNGIYFFNLNTRSSGCRYWYDFSRQVIRDTKYRGINLSPSPATWMHTRRHTFMHIHTFYVFLVPHDSLVKNCLIDLGNFNLRCILFAWYSKRLFNFNFCHLGFKNLGNWTIMLSHHYLGIWSLLLLSMEIMQLVIIRMHFARNHSTIGYVPASPTSFELYML